MPGGLLLCSVFQLEVIICMNKSHTWHLMPARLHAQVSGSQKPWQSHPQASLERRRAWSCLFSSLSIRFTPAAWRSACLCLDEYGLRTPPSSNSASLMLLPLSSSGTWSTVSLSASGWSVAPLVINWNQNKRDKVRRLLHTQAMKTNVEIKCTYIVFEGLEPLFS